MLYEVITGPVKRLTKVSNTLQRSVGAAERVFETLDEVPEISNAPNAVTLTDVKGEVVFDRVNFSYDEEPVLKDFNLEAKPGEVVALVGPSGRITSYNVCYTKLLRVRSRA